MWRWLASRFDARRLVFVEESGFNTSMRRPRARAPKGKRAYGKVPRNRGKNQTLIAAITLQGGMGESMSIEGATDALAFEAYVEHTSWHRPFARDRWWCSTGSGRTGRIGLGNWSSKEARILFSYLPTRPT